MANKDQMFTGVGAEVKPSGLLASVVGEDLQEWHQVEQKLRDKFEECWRLENQEWSVKKQKTKKLSNESINVYQIYTYV